MYENYASKQNLTHRYKQLRKLTPLTVKSYERNLIMTQVQSRVPNGNNGYDSVSLCIDPNKVIKYPVRHSVLLYTQWKELNLHMREVEFARILCLDTKGRCVWNGIFDLTEYKWHSWAVTLYNRGANTPRAHLTSDGLGWCDLPRLPYKLVYTGLHDDDTLNYRYAVMDTGHKDWVVEQRANATMRKHGVVGGIAPRAGLADVPVPYFLAINGDEIPQWEPIIENRRCITFETTDARLLPSPFTVSVRGDVRDAPKRDFISGTPWQEAMFLLNTSEHDKSQELADEQEHIDSRFRAVVYRYMDELNNNARKGKSKSAIHLQALRMVGSVSTDTLKAEVAEWQMDKVINPVSVAIRKELSLRA